MGQQPIFKRSKEIRVNSKRRYGVKAGISVKLSLIPTIEMYLHGEFNELRIAKPKRKPGKDK